MTTPSLGFDKTSPDAWLNPAQADTPMEIEMDIGDEPLIVNVQQTGFYRVNYDHTNWDLLSTALVNNHEQIHRYKKIKVDFSTQILDMIFEHFILLSIIISHKGQAWQGPTNMVSVSWNRHSEDIQELYSMF